MAPNPLLDSHEDRLQRMEEVVSQTRTDVATVVSEVAHLGAAVEKQGQDLAQQVREGFASLQASVRELEQSQQLTRQEAAADRVRIKKLEDEQKARAGKQKKINAVALGMFVTAITAFITKGVAWLWSALGKS